MMFAISFDPLQNKLKNLGKTWIYSVLVLGANNWWSHCARLQKQSTHVVVEVHLGLSKYHPGYSLKYLLRKKNQFLLEMGNVLKHLRNYVANFLNILTSLYAHLYRVILPQTLKDSGTSNYPKYFQQPKRALKIFFFFFPTWSKSLLFQKKIAAIMIRMKCWLTLRSSQLLHLARHLSSHFWWVCTEFCKLKNSASG